MVIEHAWQSMTILILYFLLLALEDLEEDV